MKKQLRNAMLAGAALMMAAPAYAEVTGTLNNLSDGALEMTVDWETPNPAGWALNIGRGGTGVPGQKAVFAAAATEGKIYKFDENGVSVWLESGLTGTSLGSDDAGNLYWQDGGAGSALQSSTYKVLPAGKNSPDDIVTIQCTAPDEIAIRADNLGRALGDFFSEEGAIFYVCPNTFKQVIAYKVANGEYADGALSIELPTEMNTFMRAQPWATSVEEAEGTGFWDSAFYLYTANGNTIYYINENGDDWDTVNRYSQRSGMAFDWFQLGDESYLVYNAKIGDHGVAWAPGDIVIVRQSDNKVVGEYIVAEDNTSGQAYEGISCFPEGDNKVVISVWNSKSGAYQITVALPGDPKPAELPELYLRGNLPGAEAWAADAQYKFDLNVNEMGAGTYTLSVPAGTLADAEWKIGSGEATNWTFAMGAKEGQDNNFNIGYNTVTIGQTTGNLKSNIQGAVNIMFVLDPNDMADGTDVDVYLTQASAAPKLYVVGAFQEWNASAPVVLEADADGMYMLELPAGVDPTIKVSTTWIDGWDGAGNFNEGNMIVENEEVIKKNDMTNYNLVPGYGDIEFGWKEGQWTVGFFYNEGAFTIAAFNETNNPNPDEPVAGLYYAGTNNGWNADTPAEFVYDTEKEVYTYDVTEGNDFKLSTVNGGGWEAFNAAGFHVDGILAANTAAALLPGAPEYPNNISTSVSAPYTIQVAKDLKSITIVKEGPVEAPETLGIIGELQMGKWAPEKVAMLTKQDDGYTFVGDVEMQGGWFSLCEHASATAGDWGGIGTRWGAATDGTAVNEGSPVPFIKGEKAFDIHAYTEYPVTVNFTVDFKEMTITIKKGGTGVESINADNAAEAEYYNLQGIRVMNPVEGQLYIVRQGDKVSKIIR